MAIINDPDLLNQSSTISTGTPNGEVFIDPSTKLIELISSTDGYGGSNLIAADGVTLQALYSFLKEEWKTDTNLIKYEFPMEAITSEQFEFINGWKLNDTNTTSRKYVRTGGWAEKNINGEVDREYMSVITLGSFAVPATHTAYYAFDGASGGTNFTYPGPVNEVVQIFGTTGNTPADAGAGNFNFRSTNMTVYIRPAPTGTSGAVTGYTYDSSTTTAIGATTVTYQAYRFPLSSVVDLDISLTDAEVASLITADSHTLRWYATEQDSNTFLTTDLFGGPYKYSIVLDNTGTGVTPTEAYNIIQYKLRQGTDIDEDGVTSSIGQLTPALAKFVGPTLQTLDIDASGTAGGVLIGNVDGNSLANFQMTDNGGTLRSFPSISTGALFFNANLYNDPAAKYWMFFDDANGAAWPGSTALLVKDYATADITGDLHFQTATPATGSATGSNGSTSAGSFTMTSAAAGWTIDNFNGKVLVISTGSNAGYYDITDTTATTVVVSPAFEATDAAMTFEIRDKNTAGQISYTFDYTGNVQNGRTSNSDAPVWVVAIGLNTGQYVAQSGTIGEGSGQNISVTAALERNYSDPT